MMDTKADATVGRLSRAERYSGIELLKIFAIFLIVTSHVVQTLSSENTYVAYQDYVLDLSAATTDIQLLVLSMMRYSGVLGNAIFFVCSAWFLLESKQVKIKKIINMLAEIWAVSVIILIIVYIVYHGNIDTKLIIQSFFPTTFSNNWFLTCYLLFYAMHPYLNKIIYSLSKTSLLRCCLVLIGLYILANYVISGLFYSSALTCWVAIYFCVAYMKLYLNGAVSSKRLNAILALIGIGGNCGIVILTNFLGLRISFFQNKLLYWDTNCSPFLILASVCLFNLARNLNIKNRAVNAVSGLSLLIYIIHENLLLRSYARPWAINFIYNAFGYDYILPLVLLLALIIFAGAAIAGAVYKIVLQKLIHNISDKLYLRVKKVYLLIEPYLLRVR
ncbi:MAG: acyltransferase [Oscillospiraceae bacterium]|nr:acyltransferase [Oscillospiraceae bacterium]